MREKKEKKEKKKKEKSKKAKSSLWLFLMSLPKKQRKEENKKKVRFLFMTSHSGGVIYGIHSHVMVGRFIKIVLEENKKKRMNFAGKSSKAPHTTHAPHMHTLHMHHTCTTHAHTIHAPHMHTRNRRVRAHTQDT